MKRRLRIAFLAFLFSFSGVLAQAAPNEVLLVFNGNTEVNRHIYTGLTQILGALPGGGFKVVATLKTSAVPTGPYKAVVIVSTSVASGLDPVLAKFLAAYPKHEDLYVVSLLTRTDSLSVTTFTKDTGPYGVDGVTAATKWSPGSRQMQASWMQELATAIAKR